MAPQAEYVPRNWERSGKEAAGHPSLFLHSSSSHISCDFSFEVLRPNLFRTTFQSKGHPLPPHPQAPIPEPVLGSEQPEFAASEKSATITHNGVAATVEWRETPIVSLQFTDAETPIHTDLPFRSYAIDGDGVAHYTRYNRNTLHVGLGEKPAPMDLSNRHFVLSATDCFGYDVYRTDPMYKHIPFLVNATPDGVVGIFSTSHSRGMYSVGSEMDGLWGPFKVYRQDHGGLEEYLITGRTLADVVRTYADLVGMPLRVPRWAFGYLAGGMKYSMLDTPRAADALMAFADQLRQHDIPCSGMQLSSGYTVAERPPQTRNVFTWNRHRFPDPAGWIAAYHARGLRLIANIKPYVLASHPSYEQLRAKGAFFTDPVTGRSAEARLWSAGGGESGVGGHIDFTSEAGYGWWYAGVKELRELGIDCMWNDNNEFTVAHDGWRCALDHPRALPAAAKGRAGGREDVGLWGRALHAELMGRASRDAVLAARPGERPFVLTRSATAGTMRYCSSSWSGDNVTSWAGMKGATALGLTAGVCLLQCYGHDVGGFEGPQPSPELLLRWVQMAVYSPRFAINCFKTSPENNRVGDVIEPWMYPDITHLVRAAIKRRYELLPFIYSLHLESHLRATPPQRWTGWGYESDPEVWSNPVLKAGETQFWFGDQLLVGGVFEPGEETAKLYLPKRAGDEDAEFLNLNAPHQYLEAGQWVTIESKWRDSVPVLAKVGAAIPVGRDVQVLSPGEAENTADLPPDDYRGVEIFPPRAGTGRWFETTWLEDDGVTISGTISSLTLRYSATESEIVVDFAAAIDGFTPEWKDLDIILPVGDGRTVVHKDGKQLKSKGQDARGRGVFTLESAL